MFPINLQWLSFPINLSIVETWMRANAGSDYRGNCADTDLTLVFENEPTDDVKEAIVSYWDGLDESSDEATSYKPKEQIKTEAASAKAAAIASAQTKLEAIGLTADEIAAIVGA